MRILSPINWIGGKYFQAKDIIKLFPQHKTYVEVFGGAGWVLFTKEPSCIEVYNDIDSNLYNLFRTLRDKEKGNRLIELLKLTPYSREEYDNCLKNLKTGRIKEFDEVEQARQFIVCCVQSFSGTIGSGWNRSITQQRQPKVWLNKIENIPLIIERLENVQIEHLDFRQCIQQYDTENTLFYLDPPYIIQRRKNNNKWYLHEMTDKDHQDLVSMLLHIKGKAVLSGYDNKIYEELENNGWQKLLLGNYALHGQKKSQKDKVQEYVWIKK